MSDLDKKTIGFIGLGLMGSAMAEVMVEAGYRLVVWNREQPPIDDLVAKGAEAATSPADVAARSDIILLCVLDTKAVEAVTLGKGGIVETGTAHKILIDHSTAMPDETRSMAATLFEKTGMKWVDAPVSGGPGFARERRLTIMLGGDTDTVTKILPLLSCYAQNVTRMGEVGSGQATKVINQAICGVGYVLMAEVLRLAEESGIDAALIPKCLAGGHGDSVILNYALPKMLAQDFLPPASLASQMLKDLKNVHGEARRMGLELPLVDTAMERFTDYVDQGGGKRETASIYLSYK